MELVHSSVVTVKLSQFNILCKNGIGESNIISDDINNIMNYTLHELSILHQLIILFPGFFSLLSSSSIDNVVLENLDRNPRTRSSISTT